MDWFMGKSRKREKESTNFDTYLEDAYLTSIVSPEELASLVQCPAGIDQSEWFATNAISFFEHINMMYGIVAEYCTVSQCTSMTAPSNLQYQWIDEKGKKMRCTASQYVDYVMTYIQQLINDETVFPTKYDNKFPSTFEASIKKIHRYLLHVLGHVYHAHFDVVIAADMHTHLNATLLHFVTYSRLHALICTDDLEPLLALFQKLNGINTSTTGPIVDPENSSS